MKIYLSGGVSNVPNYKIVFKIAEYNLTSKGLDTKRLYINKASIEVINPVKLPHNHDHSYWSYMRECIQSLAGCTMIYMLKGWWKSKGARIEWLIALLLNIQVQYE